MRHCRRRGPRRRCSKKRSAAGLALLAGLPFSLAGRSLDTTLRNRNQDLIPDGTADIERKAGQAMAKALGRSFLYGLAALGASNAILCGVILLAAPRIPHQGAEALSFMPSASVAIGLAGLVSRDLPRPGKAGLFILGMAFLKIALVLLYFMHLRYDSKWFSFIFLIPFVLVIPFVIVLLIN